MFPGAGASVYRNDAGEPLGWDYPSYGEPPDPDGFDPDDFDPDGDEEEGEEPLRCEADTRKGTGTGICDRPLDDNGYCDRANDHLD